MALSTTLSVPRGLFLGVPAAQDSHFAPAAELHVHKQKQLQARPIKVQ
jgi:1-deoxy-D-xylulose-5-phosphate synthase